MSDTVFVVQRLNWVRNSVHNPEEWCGLLRLPGATRLASYTDPDAAERDCKAREEEARAKVNPFRCGGPALRYQTRFEAAILHDWLSDLSIEPPAVKQDGTRDWISWWDREHESWTPLQRVRVWEALDQVRFHEVVERFARPVVYVVVRVGWTYNDQGYDADEEGGSPIKAYRTRERAEQAREEMEQEERREMGDRAEGYELTARVERQRDPFDGDSTEEVWADDVEQAFYEVVEIEHGE